MLRASQVPMLFEIYGAGVVATFGILAAMYRHASARRAELNLTPGRRDRHTPSDL